MLFRSLFALALLLFLPLTSYAQGAVVTPPLLVQSGQFYECSLLNMNTDPLTDLDLVMFEGGSGSVVQSTDFSILPFGRATGLRVQNSEANAQALYCVLQWAAGPCETVVSSACNQSQGACVNGGPMRCVTPESQRYTTGTIQGQRFSDVVCAVTNASTEPATAVASIRDANSAIVSEALTITPGEIETVRYRKFGYGAEPVYCTVDSSSEALRVRIYGEDGTMQSVDGSEGKRP